MKGAARPSRRSRSAPEALVFVMPPADGVILTSRFRQSVLGDEALYN